MLVISIQSQVVHGHVGNSAAVPPMQAHGVTVAAVPTTLLSNHPRYPTMRGRVLDPSLVGDLLKGVEERGLVQSADAIVTGYLGSAAIAAVVADFVERALAANPSLTYICDPVMGDAGIGLFVPADLAALISGGLVPMASIITPNQFELGVLAGAPVMTEAEIRAAFRALPAGLRAVVVTGCLLADTPANTIETLALKGRTLKRFPTPRLDIPPFGTGDLFTGLLVARLVSGASFLEAVEAAVAGTFAVVRRTATEGASELQIERSLAELIPKER